MLLYLLHEKNVHEKKKNIYIIIVYKIINQQIMSTILSTFLILRKVKLNR